MVFEMHFSYLDHVAFVPLSFQTAGWSVWPTFGISCCKHEHPSSHAHKHRLSDYCQPHKQITVKTSVEGFVVFSFFQRQKKEDEEREEEEDGWTCLKTHTRGAVPGGTVC